ncbi:MAG: hypothetical protein OIF57_12550 [Marinobacterium sp.]|nr:hypothetical protein [Marinobacterium sp.]
MNKTLLSTLVLSSIAISAPAFSAVSECHAIYDAGSSGTRLYIYQQQGESWVSHEGPKVSALADPVREIRGKTWADAPAVTEEVVGALEAIRQDGPKWKAFDWKQQCNLKSASVLATAGMRIAEQENRQRSNELWNMLEVRLQQEVGSAAKVDTRTLTGFEEGLFAWLALRETKDSSSTDGNNYGIAEMGGASAQITFPCADCDNSQNAVRTVMVDGKPVKMYSYSYLGLGQDEAPKTLTENGSVPSDCAWNVGATQADWKPPMCGAEIHLTDSDGVKDPYNYENGQQGAHNEPPIAAKGPKQWFLTGAFAYMKPTDVSECCEQGAACYNQVTSCFTSVYRLKYLATLEVPQTSSKADVSWTAGANICGVTDCLGAAKAAPVCRWSDQGCLN